MKLTVYDKSNSHPALTYKGKRIITVCRDGSMYLSPDFVNVSPKNYP